MTNRQSFIRFAEQIGIFPKSRNRLLYVAKHGDDSASGTTPEKALKTITEALTQVSEFLPAPDVDNPVGIVVLDDGVYDEGTITVGSFVNIYAPLAELRGSLVPGVASYINFRSIFIDLDALASSAVRHSGGSEVFLIVDEITCQGDKNGVESVGTGALNLKFNRISVQNGSCIGSSIPSQSIKFEGNELAVTTLGTGNCIFAADGSVLSGKISSLTAPTSTIARVTGPGSFLSLVASKLDGPVNFSVDLSGVANVVIADKGSGSDSILSGGVLNATFGGVGMDLSYIPGTPGDWTAGLPTTLNEAIDRIAAAVAFNHSPIP